MSTPIAFELSRMHSGNRDVRGGGVRFFFFFKMRDSKPSDTGLRVNTQRLERSTLSRQSKEKGHPFHVLVFF